MIIKPLSTEEAVGHATITAARVVRLVNTGATEKVTVANSAAASLTLIANTSTIIAVSYTHLTLPTILRV